MKKRYHWQPELSVAIIYWSLTLMILFYSLTLSLENTRPYWKSNLVMGFFFILCLIGLQRRIQVTDQGLKIHYSRFWKNREFAFDQLSEVEVVAAGNILEFDYQGQHYHFMMRKKTLAALIQQLQHEVPTLVIRQRQAEEE